MPTVLPAETPDRPEEGPGMAAETPDGTMASERRHVFPTAQGFSFQGGSR
jgi:hypothetical protein